VLFWCTLVVPAGIIALGINFIPTQLGPQLATAFQSTTPPPSFLWITGIRDIFAGLVILPFLWRGDRRTTATLFAFQFSSRSAMGLSFCDILALRRLSISTGNSAYMMIVAAFFLEGRNPNYSHSVGDGRSDHGSLNVIAIIVAGLMWK